MPALAPTLKKSYWVLAGFGAAYAIFMLCLTNVTLQRHALYANKLVNAWWVDTEKPQSFGFAKNQVTAFNITTPDHEQLYAWHILPLNVYAEHEVELAAASSGPVHDLAQSLSFSLLKKDPNARLVINFHGNAGNVAQGWRTDTYRSLSSLPNVHILTVDYRGFGHSTGSPTEAGLIVDATTLVKYALEILQIPPHRIVIVGQSLGTAVASAVGLQFADPAAALSMVPSGQTGFAALNASFSAETVKPVDFAGIILVAPFTSLPVLVESYRIFGVLPLLSPLRPYPKLQTWLRQHIVDTWDSMARISTMIGAIAADESRKFRLHIIHAKNDFDIRWTYGETLFQNASSTFVKLTGQEEADVHQQYIEADGGRSAMTKITKDSHGRQVILDLLAYGGHNRIVTFAPVALAVLRAFDAAAATA
ncbi:uncharacterized protein K452DRAFT_272788 [Aplosporella prunicola CBS 121167]|uniref:AB hydrolase-1 domain-containing protein n=1 Tax=Aplosporella prunicola CBS 121167 TaxID=1176127 RepID=A0A6A6BDL9_9PEZI|nr:uncharacterized protein K452DRAFT_272788 [Aplosporella prunicola CBS 121167]KAF2141007.1 hypothetical protein K452DRAFT_272788 [Aplosporella prunicola CBS 121167]